MTGANELRSVRPEAILTIDGRALAVGGLKGQPIHNFLLNDWVNNLKSDPLAFEFVGIEKGKTKERFPWQKHPEWISQDLPWPPPGVSLTFNFKPSDAACIKHDPTLKRPVLLTDNLSQLDKAWKTHVSSANDESTFTLHNVPGSIMASDHTSVFAERELPVGVRAVECLVDPGTDTSSAWAHALYRFQ